MVPSDIYRRCTNCAAATRCQRGAKRGKEYYFVHHDRCFLVRLTTASERQTKKENALSPRNVSAKHTPRIMGSADISTHPIRNVLRHIVAMVLQLTRLQIISEVTHFILAVLPRGGRLCPYKTLRLLAALGNKTGKGVRVVEKKTVLA